MSRTAEIKLNRSNTTRFIDANPADIVLIPQHRIRSTTGGYSVVQESPRTPQTMRIIDISSSYQVSQPPQRTLDGVERTVEFILLADYTAAMSLHDTWTDDRGTWEIVQMFPDNGYERRAELVRYDA
jgi:hypothetical protein